MRRLEFEIENWESGMGIEDQVFGISIRIGNWKSGNWV